MDILQKIDQFFVQSEKKRLYLYYLAFVAALVIVLGGAAWIYYRSLSNLKKQVNRTNQYRRQAQDILNRAEEVVQQRQDVDSLLLKDPNFKIGGYFKSILADLNLIQKEKMETTQITEREDNYIEHTLTATFVEINSKDLALLLETIENNSRIYTRELEIKKSDKIPGTIDTTLMIATLLPSTAVS